MIHKEFHHGDTEDTEIRTYVKNSVILSFTVYYFLIKEAWRRRRENRIGLQQISVSPW